MQKEVQHKNEHDFNNELIQINTNSMNFTQISVRNLHAESNYYHLNLYKRSFYYNLLA